VHPLIKSGSFPFVGRLFYINKQETGYTVEESCTSAASPSDEDLASLQAIREGSEAVFPSLVERYQPGLVRLARLWSREQADAEDLVQETWLVTLQSLHRFEGRSSLRTWLCGILVNLGRARFRKSARLVPMSSLGDDDPDVIEPARFWPEGHPWAGYGRARPHPWPDSPEQHALDGEFLELLERAISDLPPLQGEVLVLRDVEGLTGPEVREVLGVSESHERVLLHRARSKVRTALEPYFQARSAR
jgi:RNA polymerase sigma-70 factor, ECF subfamily